MTRWGEIKCPRCAEQDALWEGMERALEEIDAREARREARIEELEAQIKKDALQYLSDTGQMGDAVDDLTRRHQHALHKINVLEDIIEKLEAKLAEQDDLVQAAVAAKLREAAGALFKWGDIYGDNAALCVLALIPKEKSDA